MHGWGRRVLLAVAAVAAAALLVRLSLWQWERGRATGRLLHYTYAVEWLLVAALVAGTLISRRRHGGRRDQGPHDVAGRVIGPPLQPGEQLPPTTRERVTARVRRRSAG